MTAEMEAPALCRCGHDAARHDFDGCGGDRLRRCTCAHDERQVLESRFDSSRLAAPALTVARSVLRVIDAA